MLQKCCWQEKSGESSTSAISPSSIRFPEQFSLALLLPSCTASSSFITSFREINFCLLAGFVSLICMPKILLFHYFLLATCISSGQNNILLLQKKNKTIKTFFPGKFISIQTTQKNYADGMIVRIMKDTVFIRHFDIERSITTYGGIYFDTAYRYTTAIHFKDIGAIALFKNNSSRKINGTILLIAGGGVLVLGAVNGLYRGDPPKNWYKPSGFITAGALTTLALLTRRSANKKYSIGKKSQLKILLLNSR